MKESTAEAVAEPRRAAGSPAPATGQQRATSALLLLFLLSGAWSEQALCAAGSWAAAGAPALPGNNSSKDPVIQSGSYVLGYLTKAMVGCTLHCG